MGDPVAGPRLIEQFVNYFNSGDVEGLASLYEDGAAFIAEPGTELSDAGGLRAALQGFLDTKGTLTIVSTSEVVNGDLALTHNHWRLDVPGGEPMEHTSAEVARRQPDGTWMSLASVMGPPRCHEHGTTWRCQ